MWRRVSNELISKEDNLTFEKLSGKVNSKLLTIDYPSRDIHLNINDFFLGFPNENINLKFEKSAYNQGHRLMNDDEVQELLTSELADSKERNLQDHDSIIEQLKDEALGKVHGHTSGSRVKALELLMKYYQMIDSSQKLELSMKDSWFEQLEFDSDKDHLN